jgi:hypothetical protein
MRSANKDRERRQAAPQAPIDDLALEADDAEILRTEDVQAGWSGPAWTP